LICMNTLITRWRTTIILACHASIVCVSLAAAFLLRFEFSLPASEWVHLTRAVPVALAVKLLTLHFGRVYRGGWRYVGMIDLKKILQANLVASVLFSIASYALVGANVPRSIYFVDFLLCFLLTAGARFAFRIYHEGLAQPLSSSKQKAILVYGAGAAGIVLLKEIRTNPDLHYKVVGFLDDAPGKRLAFVAGTPVLGAGRDVAKIVTRLRRRGINVEEILIAMPSATGRQMQEAVANCRSAGVGCKTVPGMSELLSGGVLIRQMRNISPVDLLGRNPVHVDERMVRSFIRGRSVMVTGAGGSIGSELCRQVARFEPAQLVAFEQGETDLFKIEREMRSRYPSLDFRAEIGDIRDRVRLDDVMRRNEVNCIFHAAAYKHVPMMEQHLLEAVKNNVLGTRNVVAAAQQHHVTDFVMISSDKAVKPTNVMGLTKRVAELLVCSMPVPAGGGGTKFVSVRFGNVLGSNGSVIPVFKQQIEAGGPVTVTHPDMTRYFMTISEAVELVLQSSVMGKGSEIFVLDMGEPVRIVDLAKNMIRLAGYEPYTDIEIRFTGLRPGEKLYEELMLEGEDIVATVHEKIKIFQGPPVQREAVASVIREVEDLLERRDEAGVISCLRDLVPEYQPGEKWRQAVRLSVAVGS
jgi:FlaA1/EpsC-like NDP-sugar epimerase